MKYTLSKKIVHKLLEKEISKTGVEIKIFPVNDIENIKRIIKKEIELKRKLKDVTIPKMLEIIIKKIKDEIEEKKYTLGFFDGFDITILLSNIEKNSETKEEFLWNLLRTTYHEYNHVLAYNHIAEKDELIKYKIYLDEILATISFYYKNHHDEFYIEILANNYSIEKTIEFVKQYPNIYQKLQFDMEKIKLLFQIYSQNYDPQQQLNHISKRIKNKDAKAIDKDFKEVDNISSLFKKDGTPTLQKNLSQEENYIIVSSKAYLDNLDYNNQSKEKLKFILEALNYTYNIEKNRYQQNEQLKKLMIEKDDIIKELTKNPYIIYYQILLPTLEKKQTRVEKKLKYLELQITKINIILNQKKDNKKLIRKPSV